MTSLLDNRILTLLLSIVLAVGLWFHVHGEFQIRRTLVVKLHYSNTEDYVARGARDQSIAVDVRGPAVMVQRLQEQQHIIDIDLGQFRPGPVAYGNFDAVLRKEFPRDVDILSIQPRTIQFEVDQYATVTLPVSVQLDGTPPEGFEVTRIIVKPERLTIGGSQKALHDLQTFDAGLVRVSDQRKDRVVELEASSPSADYWVVGAKKLTVTVEIRERKIQRDFEVPVELVHAGFPANVAPDHVFVTLSGPYNAVHTLEPKQIVAFIDARDLKPGVYRRPIAIEPPDSVEVLSFSPQMFSVRLARGEP